MGKKLLTKNKKVLVTAIAAILFLACFISNYTAYAAQASNPNLKVTVTYNPNGGRGDTRQFSVTSNAEYTIENQGYTRDFYAFYGWNTIANGTGTYYPDGQIIKTRESITLYAMWRRAT